MHIWTLTSIKTVHPSAEKGAGEKKIGGPRTNKKTCATNASKYRNAEWGQMFVRNEIWVETWNALIAFWRSCSLSIPENLEPFIAYGIGHALAIDEALPTWCEHHVRLPNSLEESSNVPKLSFKCKPLSHMAFLQSNIHHCKTALNNRGLSTHPWRMPLAQNLIQLFFI